MAVADIYKADVLALAPSLTLTDQGWVEVLTYVNELDLSSLGESEQVTRLARIYLAAHFGTLTQQSTTDDGAPIAGPVVSESAGGIRRAYGFNASAQSNTLGFTNLESTIFGQMYMRIIGMSAARGPLVC